LGATFLSNERCRPSSLGVLFNKEPGLKTHRSSASLYRRQLPASSPSDLSVNAEKGWGRRPAEICSSAQATLEYPGSNLEVSEREHQLDNELCERINGLHMGPEQATASLLDLARELLVDRAMEEFWVMFNEGLPSDVTQHAGYASGDSSSPGFQSTSSNEEVSKPASGKRQRDADGDSGDRENDKKPRQGGKRYSSKESEDGVKFACPFRKHNPRKYNLYSRRLCTLSHWRTIARVKLVSLLLLNSTDADIK